MSYCPARFDLVYRPIDHVPTEAATRDWSASPVATLEELREDVARVTRLVRAEAMPFWDAIGGIEDLPTIYREHRARPSIGLPFANFPQQVLASAFVSAKCGRGEGRSELAEYIRAYDVGTETASRLEKLLEEAAA